MAAFDFPNSPSTNDTYSANGVTFQWNGSVWTSTIKDAWKAKFISEKST